MAIIIVEDGSGVAGANSYISEADLLSYATDRGTTLSTATDVLILRSMDYIEMQRFIGVKAKDDQSLEWPRADLYKYKSNEIPAELIKAQFALCVQIDIGNDPLSPGDRQTKREKVDVIEVEYMDGARSRASIPSVDRWLSMLTLGNVGGSLGVVRVGRA